ncbi:uncharacterized protein ACLA_089460 [Aspergillus clavatus NRRL 1]|uniref:Rhodopsin domain-containing protein n=1 Tax=Aspergillus clavatus (strain ATCC 1007 / CBS 513.65 / DSM 816 / NCTC 3887 / NRRL 1 / QM 1276 / 107) TaxID=344612 RepID=A1CEF5_ASPCL|nr:uncharacterized protein ACLA_089460 [Aspergillus clavatus NRRL 1]EAW11254.1 hypothetical protein ACLA_089460 [Aspergillus clavatus NRRL 1]
MGGPSNAGLHQPFNVVSLTGFGISALSFFARCYTAWMILHRTASDLYLAIATFIIGTASQIFLTLATASYGIGVYESTLSEDDKRKALLCAWLNQFLALIAIGLGKVAIVAFIVLFQGYQKRIWIIFLWFVGLSSLLLNVVPAILLLVQCRPVRNCGTNKHREGVMITIGGRSWALYKGHTRLYVILFWRSTQWSSSGTSRHPQRPEK